MPRRHNLDALPAAPMLSVELVREHTVTSIVDLPAVGRSRPSSRRIVVDLPAPFGPRNPVTTPGRTAKVKSSTAVLAP